METTLAPDVSSELSTMCNKGSFYNDTEWKGPFTFVQGADTQFGFIDSYLLKLEKDGWDKEILLTKEAVRRINNLNPKPKFFVICGDMLDKIPAPGKDEEIRNQQLSAFITSLKDLDPEIKLVCVCGNHDVGNVPTEYTVKLYRKQFGSDYFSFWVGGVKFVVLNSQYFKEPKALPEETKAQELFMSSIKDPNAKHIVVFQHIPFFIDGVDEPSSYYSVDRDVRESTLEKLYSYGVRYVFTGHMHKNGYGEYKDLKHVITSAVGGPLGKNPSGFRVVNVTEKEISHIYVPFTKTTDMNNIQFV